MASTTSGGAARRGTVLAGSLVLALLAVAWLVKLGASSHDDFFISFTYARNLVEGRGFVFNPGERVFGVTNPGFTLLLALLNLLTRVPIHVLGSVVSGLALLLVALFLLWEASERDRFWEGLLGGLLVLGSSYLWTNVGGEWSAVLAVFLVSARIAERKPILAGVLMGLAVWLRPDAGLGVAVLGLMLWTKGRRLPWRYGIAAGATIAVGALAAWLYFGTLVPQSFVAKKAMALAEEQRFAGARFWHRIVPIAHRHFGGLWPWLAALGGAGLFVWWRRSGPGGRLLMLYAAVLAVYYPLSGVQFFTWYVAPCVVALLVGVAYLAGGLARWAWAAFSGKRIAIAVGGSLLSLAVLVPVAVSISASCAWYRSFRGNTHLETYRRAALWLAENRPLEERIAYVEIGVLGYFSRHPIQDLMGLVSPEVLPHVERGDIVGAFLERPTEIVLFHTRGRMAPIVSAPWFAAAYEKAAYFEDQPAQGSGLTVFHLKEGAALPAPSSAGSR